MAFELASVSTNTITISTVQAVDGNIEPDSNNLFANASSLVIGNATHTSVVSAEGVSSPYLSVGNSLDNVTINSTSFQIDGNGANTYIDAFLAQFSGTVSVGNDLDLSGGLFTNGSLGTAGDVLHSNGTALYWAADEQGVTSVTAGNGLSGGTITTTGTISVVANTGIVSNTSGLFVNSAYIGTLTANNANNLGGTAAASYVQNTDSRTLSGNLNFTGANVNYTSNLTIASTGELIITAGAGIYANGGLGSAGQVLHSNGTSIYWDTDDPGVTSVATGNGLTGGTITTTGTISVVANTGLVSNTSGLFVNSTYIGTLTANNANNLGGTAAASYVQNTDSRTLSGNLNFTGANVNFTGNLTIASTGELIITAGAGIYANGGLGSAGQVLTSNGTSIYWSTSAGGFTNGSSISVNNFVLTGAFSANSSNGGSGNFLRSSGTGAYWANVSILDVYYANNTLAYSATGNSLTTGITTGKSIAMAMIFGG